MKESCFYRAEIFVVMPQVAHHIIGIDYVVPDSWNFLAYQRAVVGVLKPSHGFIFHQRGSEGTYYQCFEFWSDMFRSGEGFLPVKEIEARVKFRLPELYLAAEEEYNKIASSGNVELQLYDSEQMKDLHNIIKRRAKDQRESKAVLA